MSNSAAVRGFSDRILYQKLRLLSFAASLKPPTVKYDDGGFSGSNTDRPALQRLLEDVRAGKIDVIVTQDG